MSLPGPASEPPVVVIDPGHGGNTTGAVGVCGVLEKDIALAVGLELAALLRISGKAIPALTRDSDHNVPLEQRAHLANTLKAALFLSIHANASTNPTSHGVETFFLSRHSSDRRIHQLVRRENEGRRRQLDSAGGLEDILDQLAMSASHRESQHFAIRLHEHLQQRTDGEGRGVLQAPFVVLQESTMPAALVEVGFLTHAQECRRLATLSYQQQIAQDLGAAIIRHLSIRTHQASHIRQTSPTKNSLSMAKAIEFHRSLPGSASDSLDLEPPNE